MVFHSILIFISLVMGEVRFFFPKCLGDLDCLSVNFLFILSSHFSIRLLFFLICRNSLHMREISSL